MSKLTNEELELRVLELEEEINNLTNDSTALISSKDEEIRKLQRANTKLFDRITSKMSNDEDEDKDEPKESLDDLLKRKLGGINK